MAITPHLGIASNSLRTRTLAAILLLGASVNTLEPHFVPHSQRPLLGTAYQAQESPESRARRLKREREERDAKEESLAYCREHAGKSKEHCAQFYTLVSDAVDAHAPQYRLTDAAPALKADAMRLMHQESRYDPDAVSPKAAVGLMQVHHPDVFRKYASREQLDDGTIAAATELSGWQRKMISRRERHLFDWQENIDEGVRRLLSNTHSAQRDLCRQPGEHKEHEHPYSQEVRALRDAKYNFGPGNVSALLGEVGRYRNPRTQILKLYERLPKETREYGALRQYASLQARRPTRP